MADDGPGGSITLGDLAVARLGFGAMRLTGPGVWGPPADRTEAHRVLRRAVEGGVTLIDTSDAYGPDVNEEVIAEALHPYPAGVVIATKGGLTRSGPGEWHPKGDPAHLRAACEGSLRRLRVERIDLYQLHRPDPGVPYEDSVGALADLQREGKVRHVGVSNVDRGQLDTAESIVDVVSVQNRYNVADRADEEVLRHCEEGGIAYIPWFPLGGNDADAAMRAVGRVAARRGATPRQVAIAWLLARSEAMLPIPGTSTVGHLDENLAAADLELTTEDLAELG